MEIREIKERYSDDLLNILTEPDKSGRGYICPLCGAGDGKHGTGLTKVKNKPGYYHCFSAGCEFHGDILQLIGAVYHLNDTKEQIVKAGELLHVDLTGKEEWQRERQQQAAMAKRPAKAANVFHNPDQSVAPSVPPADVNLANEIKSFMAGCAAAFTDDCAAAKYVLKRGISLEVARNYGLGYCANYDRDGMYTPALIIPTGPDSYTARSLTDDGNRKVRKRKAGDRAGVFNIGCLDKDPQIVTYVVEGEIDALSIISAGCQAIATGGGTGKRALVEELQKRKNVQTLYVVLPDNDLNEAGDPDLSKGYKQGKELNTMLCEASVRSAFFDTSDPKKWPAQCKDINDYLVSDPEGCVAFLQGIKQRREDKMLGCVSACMPDFKEHIAGKTSPVSTGFPSLDQMLDGGLRPGLNVLGAISSLGKTTFILNICENMAMAGQDVLVFSLEMSRFELISKVISERTAKECLMRGLSLTMAKTNLGISDFDRRVKYSEMEKKLIDQCTDDFTETAAKHIYIHEGVADMGTSQVEAIIKRHIQVTGRKPVVMIDYLQILAPADPHSTDKQNTDRNIVAVKRISRDYNIPVLAVSSYNRESYDEPVSMSSYKESGMIEFGSDVLIALQYMGMDYFEGEKKEARLKRIRDLRKENRDLSNSGKPIKIQIKILKNRSGAKCDGGILYYPMFNYYVDLQDPLAEENPL